MNGIIVLDKPKGITSFQAARIVSRALGKEKTGHTGTLDPMATGVLPVMVGRATKLLQYLPETRKEYEAEALFGIRTDTADADGAVLETGGRIPTEKEFSDALLGMRGKGTQVPPMYSAIKREGVPLYELARKGVEIDREPRQIEIYDVKLLSFSENTVSFRVTCSAGTYVRTLAEDAAAKCGALCHLTSLRRTSACGFGIGSAVTAEELERAAAEGEASRYLISPGFLFRDLPEIRIGGEFVKMFLNGVDISMSRIGEGAVSGTRVKVIEGEDLLGLADITAEGALHKLWQGRTAD